MHLDKNSLIAHLLKKKVKCRKSMSRMFYAAWEYILDKESTDFSGKEGNFIPDVDSCLQSLFAYYLQ